MSYHIKTNNKTAFKYMADVKRHPSICSMDGCLSRVQRNSLCSKHLQPCKKTKNSIKIKKTERYTNVSKRNRSDINRWLANSAKEFSADDSNVNTNQIETILSEFQHHLEHNFNPETYIQNTQLNSVIDEEMKSESSVEYDYTNPNQNRHVSIATIHLQEKQWHQLELFIKHFSSYASLSNNMNINSSTTHLLIDDSQRPHQCIFSKKIFQAAARNISIVSIRWIEECLRRNEILDEGPFEIHGDGTMSTLHLTRHSSTNRLFPSSIAFVIDCVSFQQALTRNELAELVLLTGATLFDSEQTISTDVLLILVDPTADRFLLKDKYKQWHHNVKFLTSGFLLKSIIYQKQQPFEDFEL